MKCSDVNYPQTLRMQYNLRITCHCEATRPKQSPIMQLGDCFVAKTAPRKDKRRHQSQYPPHALT